MKATDEKHRPNAINKLVHDDDHRAAKQSTATRRPRPHSSSSRTNAFASLEALVLTDQRHERPKIMREHPTNTTTGDRCADDGKNGGSTPKKQKTTSQARGATNLDMHPLDGAPSSQSTLSPSPVKMIEEPLRDDTAVNYRTTGIHATQKMMLKVPRQIASSAAAPVSMRKATQSMKPSMAKTSTSDRTTAKSIVGSRPVHWGALTPKLAKADAMRNTGRDKRKTVAAAAVAIAPRDASKIKEATTILKQPLRPSFDARNLCQRREQGPPHEPLSDAATAATSKRLSFAPSFAPTTVGATNKSSEETVASCDDESMLGFDANHQTASLLDHAVWQPPAKSSIAPEPPTSPVQGRRSSRVGGAAAAATAGPLAKRLQAIRERVNGDKIRLSSGQYPFRAKSNANDPRKRADSFCDVTILGPPAPWGVYDNHQKKDHLVIVSGCVHATTVVSTSATIRQSCPNDEFVWIVLPSNIAYEQNLALGTQLRIYDPTIVGLQPQLSERTEQGNDQSSAAEIRSRRVLLCKHLCEAYPQSLPPLSPDPSYLVNVAAGDSCSMVVDAS